MARDRTGRRLNSEGKNDNNPNPNSAGARSVDGFETGSISGTYAVVLETGANEVSALGVIDCDGEGNLLGDIRFNELDEENPPARALTTSALSGTYSLESNGLGELTIEGEEFGEAFSLPAGILVTEVQGSTAVSVDGNFLVPSGEDGALTLFTMTKRDSDFGDGSLIGNYAFEVIAGPNLGHANGVMTFDGEGGFTGQLKGNAPKDNTERDLFETPLMGTYSTEHHGYVEMNLTFVVMKDDVPFIPVTLLITEAEGTQASNLKGNFGIPSPILQSMNLPSLMTVKLDYIGSSGTTIKTE